MNLVVYSVHNLILMLMLPSSLIAIDGYPRELGNGRGKVCIRGKTFPVAGNVCMDMLMVDLGSADDICDVGAQVSIGDTVSCDNRCG